MKTNREKVKSMFDLDFYEDTISMWVADMDFACPPKMLDALKERIDRQVLGYTMEDDAYYNSIIGWYKRRHQMEIKKEWLQFSNGTISAIRNCLKAFTEAGDGVIIQPPVYYPFEGQIQQTKRRVVRNHLIKDDENNYAIDFDDFEEKCRQPENKMFIYCNPHNPVGRIWSAEDTQRLLKICHENDVIFFSDEIHCDLIRKGQEFTSALNLDFNEKAVIATAVNKSFNVAGLHITNLVIANQELMRKLNDYTGYVFFSPLVSAATIAAYNDCEDWLRELNDVLDDNMNYMDDFVKKYLPRVKFVKPEGTYLTWMDFSDYGMSERELLVKMADEAHLIIEGGSIFGDCGTGFLRMNVACPREVLKDALNRILKVFGE